MNSVRKTSIALVCMVALGSVAVTTAPEAFAGKPAPCAKQQTQVDKATVKLAELTTKFAAHPTKKNKRAEKAQVQRVAHATVRLDKCLASQPS